MKTYTFKSNNADKTATVTATTEAEARKLPMKQIWGPPRGIYPGENEYGHGLYLIDEKETR